jgi:hypothetical protein
MLCLGAQHPATSAATPLRLSPACVSLHDEWLRLLKVFKA